MAGPEINGSVSGEEVAAFKAFIHDLFFKIIVELLCNVAG